MNRSKILAAIVVALGAVVIAFSPVNADPRLQIILDVSGSMRGQAGGQEKIVAAKQAILATIDALEEGSLVPGGSERPYFLTALRFYGHRLASEPKDESCGDTELVIPFQPLDRNRFVSALEAAVPRGQTPISTSLEQAAADFGEIGEDPAVIILVSDGEETCGGDPVATACELASQGFDITMHTVGFDVGAEAKRELEGIADCTGGEYRDAGDAEQLGETLTELTAVSFVVDKQRGTAGQPIRGGDAHDDAVPLEPGALYHLDHHQRVNEFDYFYVDVASGQKLIAAVDPFERGVRIRGDQAEEIVNPSSSCAGIAVDGPDGGQIGYEYEIKPRQRAGLEVPLSAGMEGRYYIRVGPDFCGQHMNSTFRIELIDLSDAGSGDDVGSQADEAMEIQPGRGYTGHLHRNDPADMFRFRATEGAPFSIRARPAERKILALQALDDDGVILVETKAPNEGAAVRIDSVAAPRDGHMFLKVADASTYTRDRNLESPYSLEVAGPVAAAEVAIEKETGEPNPATSDTEEGEMDGDQPVDQGRVAGASGEAEDGGISLVLMLLALLVVGAALAGGVVLGRRTR